MQLLVSVSMDMYRTSQLTKMNPKTIFIRDNVQTAGRTFTLDYVADRYEASYPFDVKNPPRPSL